MAVWTLRKTACISYKNCGRVACMTGGPELLLYDLLLDLVPRPFKSLLCAREIETAACIRHE